MHEFPDGNPGTVYLVTTVGYDHHEIMGAFSTREAADDYCTDLQRFMHAANDSEEARVEEFRLNPPRESLAGCWRVYIDATGNEVEREATGFGTASDGARLLTGKWTNGAVVDAWGLTPEAALEAARALLARYGPKEFLAGR